MLQISDKEMQQTHINTHLPITLFPCNVFQKLCTIKVWLTFHKFKGYNSVDCERFEGYQWCSLMFVTAVVVLFNYHRVSGTFFLKSASWNRKISSLAYSQALIDFFCSDRTLSKLYHTVRNIFKIQTHWTSLHCLSLDFENILTSFQPLSKHSFFVARHHG